jgi:hypothetical protein
MEMTMPKQLSQRKLGGISTPENLSRFPQDVNASSGFMLRCRSDNLGTSALATITITYRSGHFLDVPLVDALRLLAEFDEYSQMRIASGVLVAAAAGSLVADGIEISHAVAVARAALPMLQGAA